MYLKYKYGFKNLFNKRVNGVLICILIFFLLTIIGIKKVEPVIISLCNSKATSFAYTIANNVIKENVDIINYDNLVKLDKNEIGQIKALQINTLEMNKISSIICKKIQENLNEKKNVYIKIKISRLFGESIFSSFGPSLKIKVVPTGGVTTEVKTEFREAGINQTKHSIYLVVKTKARIISPFVTKPIEAVNQIDIAETIIVGDIPTTYNIQEKEK